MANSTNTTVYALTPDIEQYIELQIAERDEAWRALLAAAADATEYENRTQARDMNIGWLLTCGALVFFMQCGFAMLETGVVHPKNNSNIIFKNIIDASIAAFCFWLLGWGFAYGEDLDGFIGTTYFAASDVYNGAGYEDKSDGWEKWFFQWAFSGTCATIVAGSVAERTRIEAYFIYSFFITAFIYPVVAHWGWGTGWLSAWGSYPDTPGAHTRGRVLGITAPGFVGFTDDSNGLIDFAGGGVVHMVGGFAGLMGAIVVGPRQGRFNEKTPWNHPAYAHHANKTLQGLGTMILWFTWYGVTCGKTLKISGGSANIAGKCAMNTTLAACTGNIVATLLSKAFDGLFEYSMSLNGIIAGLVSITAVCAVVEPWMAVLIGAIGALVLYSGHYFLIWLRIDDPLDAAVVHGFCGLWGLFAAGLFCTDTNVAYAGYPNHNDACATGEQLGLQAFGAMAIVGWTVATSGLMFLFINWTVGMRVTENEEETGLDPSEHGSVAASSYHGIQGYPLIARPHSTDYSFMDGSYRARTPSSQDTTGWSPVQSLENTMTFRKSKSSDDKDLADLPDLAATFPRGRKPLARHKSMTPPQPPATPNDRRVAWDVPLDARVLHNSVS